MWLVATVLDSTGQERQGPVKVRSGVLFLGCMPESSEEFLKSTETNLTSVPLSSVWVGPRHRYAVNAPQKILMNSQDWERRSHKEERRERGQRLVLSASLRVPGALPGRVLWHPVFWGQYYHYHSHSTDEKTETCPKTRLRTGVYKGPGCKSPDLLSVQRSSGWGAWMEQRTLAG